MVGADATDKLLKKANESIKELKNLLCRNRNNIYLAPDASAAVSRAISIIEDFVALQQPADEHGREKG